MDGKVALLVDRRLSTWKSCRTITPNIEKSYESACDNLLRKKYFTEQSQSELLKLAKILFAAKPKQIVFTSHQVGPLRLLKAMEKVFGANNWPELIFHVYGDFTLFLIQWSKAQYILKGKKIKLVCASDRHRKLISQLINSGTRLSFLCPFSIDKDRYVFDRIRRKTIRANLGLRPDEKVILYAGRISLQKNVSVLAKHISALMNQSSEKIKFLIAGNIDRIGAPFFGVGETVGVYFRDWQWLVEESPVKDRIQLLGEIGPALLADIYNAADLFVSLSTHHDEDFGMAPLEALSCGCPAVLSSWGGYSSFDRPGHCRLTPVSITKQGLMFSPEDFKKKVLSLLHFNSDVDRQARALAYQDSFSIETAGKKLKDILSTPAFAFEGFSLVTQHLLLRIANDKNAPFFPQGPTSQDSLYFQIYSNYVNGSNKLQGNKELLSNWFETNKPQNGF